MTDYIEHYAQAAVHSIDDVCAHVLSMQADVFSV
jgi:hypothetical protein